MGRSKKQEPEDNGIPAWMTTFGDLMTLLLTFFVLLVTYSDMERGKLIEIARSFRGAMKVLPSGLSPDLGAELYLPSPDEFTKGKMANLYPNREALETLKRQFKEAGGGSDVILEWVDEGLSITLTEKLLFDSGVAEIKGSSKAFLDIVANTIKKSPVKAVIRGHTDNIPINTEVFPSNWELSAMRAIHVMRYMLEAFRIPLDRVEARGCGQFRPLEENTTVAGRARNRRVEIVFEPLEEANVGQK